ncbi:MAG: SAM-dependent methyltransferase, partial [Pseudomonadota bacterium]
MSDALNDIIKRHIAQHGPMDVGQFMNVALCHPEHGYYMKQDPFGKDGDFTTAPEISQMFGEVIGAWVADLWLQMGSPTPFGLVECGPGRGTLMKDIMRATEKVPDFHASAILHLIEISPTLKTVQGTVLEDYPVHWHQSLGAVPTSYPLIILGNEFFDALPFRQLVKATEGWAECVVTEELSFGLRPAGAELISQIPEHLQDEKDGAVLELSPVRSAAMENICDLLQQAGWAGLFLDYGYAKSATGDSFQA